MILFVREKKYIHTYLETQKETNVKYKNKTSDFMVVELQEI